MPTGVFEFQLSPGFGAGAGFSADSVTTGNTPTAPFAVFLQFDNGTNVSFDIGGDVQLK